MASSSLNTFEGVDDEMFDQHFDQTFENLSPLVIKKNKGKEGKNEFILKEIVKKAM